MRGWFHRLGRGVQLNLTGLARVGRIPQSPRSGGDKVAEQFIGGLAKSLLLHESESATG